jgi:quinol monooxygenase YgiN
MTEQTPQPATAPTSDVVVVVAVFTAATGKLDELRTALVEAIPAVHAEAGCELYAIHDAPGDQIYMLEKWSSADLLDAHGDGPAVARLQELTRGLTAGPPEVIRMRPIPAGTPAQGLL